MNHIQKKMVPEILVKIEHEEKEASVKHGLIIVPQNFLQVFVIIFFCHLGAHLPDHVHYEYFITAV